MQTFKLNEKEATEYIILEVNKDNALLKRILANEAIVDPTPYIIAHGYNVHDGTIEWRNGEYCKDLFEATQTFKEEIIRDAFAGIEKYLKKYDEKFELSAPNGISANVIYNFTTQYKNVFLPEEILTIDIVNNNDIYCEGIPCEVKAEFAEQYPLVLQALDEILENYKCGYPSDTLISSSDNISVSGHKGTWYVVDTKDYNGEKLFLLEHEEYGDEAPCVIVNGKGNLKLEEVYDGFDDYEEFLESEEMEM